MSLAFLTIGSSPNLSGNSFATTIHEADSGGRDG